MFDRRYRTINKILLFIGIAVLCFGAGVLVCALVFRGKRFRSKKWRLHKILLAFLVGCLLFVLTGLGYILISSRQQEPPDIPVIEPADDEEPVTPDEEPEVKPELLADRLNDKSVLMDSGREYEFPQEESDVYTSMASFSGIRVLSIASQEHSDTVVIYIHGGSYLNDFENGFYYPMVKQITMETGYEVLVPQYPLLMGFNYTHTYIALQSLYYRVVAEYGGDHVILMADSAGGSIAAGLCMQAAENGWERLSQLVLVSPWVDLMITHPDTEMYDEIDQTLDAYMLRLYGEYWAAGTDPTDYHLSPLYGDVTALPNVTLYYGDSELFTPMEQQFYDKLVNNGVPCEQIIGTGKGHNYAISDQGILHELCEKMAAKQATAEASS